MLALVTAHLVLALLLPLVSARSRRAAFVVAAVPPAVTLIWALAQASGALDGGIGSATAWAPTLGLALNFRLDGLALAMIVLVSGLGAVIFVYCAGYFGERSGDATRSAALLLTFAGVMLGLVLADDLLTLYVFWELTSVASYLLVGQSGEKKEARKAAVQALLVTVLGGLTMLLGFLLLGAVAGTYRISAIIDLGRAGELPGGWMLTTAMLLILVGAFTKSAQLPFHPWLPGAMAAPTPVSAYLHAASMVKAGVYLVARLSPAFSDQPVWWGPIIVVGLGTMFVGGWRALAETDLKRVLAYGTVSQLGFLMVLMGGGGRIAAVAGIGMLLAHGLFKAPLFLAVGAIDHAAGTRDLRKLSGLHRSMRGLAITTTLAAASMAGIPPLLGFVGKEAAFEAFLHEGGTRGWTVAIGLLLGSVLTVAYTTRLLWGAFADKPGVEPTPVRRQGVLVVAPVWVTALLGLAGGLAAPVVDRLASDYAADSYAALDAEEAGYHLALWHGVGLPLLFSALAVAGGLLVHLFRVRQARLAGFWPFGAQRGYEAVVGGLDRAAVEITGRVQVGSLPGYLGAILTAVVLLPGGAVLLFGTWPADVPLYHSVAQIPLALLAIVAALAVVRTQHRFTAVLLVGVIGYVVGGLFVVDGAPDLALAQFLVETLSLVAFVFVLRRLPSHFTQRPTSRRTRIPQIVVATLGGIVVAAIAVVLSGARVGPPSVSDDFAAQAREGAGAYNIVSAIIIEFRALDTVVEIGVLFIAAAGVASLVLATRYDKRTGPAQLQPGGDQESMLDTDPDDPEVGEPIIPDGRTDSEKEART